MKKCISALVLALLMVSIPMGLPETVKVEAQALPKVRVGHIPFHYYTIWRFAKDKGWDKEVGIDIELKFYSSGSPLVTGFAAHEVDIGVFAFTPMMVATSKGVDVVIIGCIQHAIGMTVVATQAPIKRMEDLKGRKVGYARATNFELVFKEVAKLHGLKAEDFEILNLAAPEVYAAMAAGRIDGGCVDVPVAWTLQQSYNCNIVGGGFELWEKVTIPDVMMAVKGFAEANPLLTVKTMAVYYRAQKYFLDNPDFAVTWITDMQNNLTGATQTYEASKVALEKIRCATPEINLATYLKKGNPQNMWDAIRNVGQIYIDYGIVTTIPDPEKVIVTKYMEDLVNMKTTANSAIVDGQKAIDELTNEALKSLALAQSAYEKSDYSNALSYASRAQELAKAAKANIEQQKMMTTYLEIGIVVVIVGAIGSLYLLRKRGA